MLDPNGRKEVIRAVRALNQAEDITVVLITHYMEEIIHADRAVVMDKGHVAMQGTPREIFSQVGKLKELRLDVPQVTLLAHELRKKGCESGHTRRAVHRPYRAYRFRQIHAGAALERTDETHFGQYLL